jgi:hypothetical protein
MFESVKVDVAAQVASGDEVFPAVEGEVRFLISGFGAVVHGFSS